MKPIPWVFRFQAAAEPAGQGPCSAPGATDHAGAAGDVRSALGWPGGREVRLGRGISVLPGCRVYSSGGKKETAAFSLAVFALRDKGTGVGD